MDDSNDDVYEEIQDYFFNSGTFSGFRDVLESGHEAIEETATGPETPRVGGFRDDEEFDRLVEKYAEAAGTGSTPEAVLDEIGADLFQGVPRWESPKLQLNVGTAPNVAALAAYTLALKNNVYAIHEGLAGNTLAAEEAVTELMADLAGVETTPKGLFIFGGTATNLYAQKLGLNRALPEAPEKGITEPVQAVVSADSHFSHETSLNWLGIGRENVREIERGEQRQSDVNHAEALLRDAIESGVRISTIGINGGTTFNHLVDDIAAFRELRDRLVEEYELDYTPHLHVDSVIGASWLFFSGYDFDANPLDITPEPLARVRRQYERISDIHLADSWSFDFHKGVGSCPIDCSLFVVNDQRDLQHLLEGDDIDTSQLSNSLSSRSPGDFTLENSRSAGPALAALASIRTLGRKGYRRNLANLVEGTMAMRDRLGDRHDVHVCHPEASLGFVTMLRLYPPERAEMAAAGTEITDPTAETAAFSEAVNEYVTEFFAWDKRTRMDDASGVEYAFAAPYTTLANGVDVNAVKLYPVSPHFDGADVKTTTETLLERKAEFDRGWTDARA